MNYINPNEHVFVAGMTQTGKTYLTKQYLANNPKPVFALGSKGVFNWNVVDQKQKKVIKHLHELKYIDIEETPYVVYIPVFEELNIDYYNEFFKSCYRLGNCTVIVDEVMQICRSPLILPEYYKAILTRGMELGVGVWSLSQRPAMIPVSIITESTHMFVFRLNNKHDRRRLVDNTSYEEFLKIPPNYYFWYFNTKTGEKPVMGKLIERGKKHESK